MVELADGRESWSAAYRAIEPLLRGVLTGHAVDVQHAGSTSVPELVAKPVLDVVAGVALDADERGLIDALESVGFSHRGLGEGSVGRLFVWESVPDVRLIHLHAVEHGSEYWRHYIDFRDRLRADPQLRADYAQLKRELGTRHADDRRAYTSAKAAFIHRAVGRHQTIETSPGVSVPIHPDIPTGFPDSV